MANRLWIAGVDVEATLLHGIVAMPGWRDPITIGEQLTQVPGRPASLPGPRVYQPRPLRLVLSVGRNTDAWNQRADRLDDLYSLCGSGVQEVPIRVGDQQDRAISGRLISGNPAARAPLLESIDGKSLVVPLEFLCRDPRWEAIGNSTVSAIGTTAVDIPTGTAQIGGVLTITGGTDPVLTIRDHTNAVRYTMTFAATLGASETITIDFGRGTIDTSLTDTTGLELWEAGFLSGEVFPRLTSDLWTYYGDDWMTFRLSAGTGSFVYRRMWIA